MKLTIIRKSSQWVHPGEEPPAEITTIATVPDNSNCQWDANQHTLIVRNLSGSVLTAFSNVFTFYADGVEIEAKP